MAKKAAKTVKVLVLNEFYDKYDRTTLYTEGTELEVDIERAQDLQDRGLAKIAEPEEKE